MKKYIYGILSIIVTILTFSSFQSFTSITDLNIQIPSDTLKQKLKDSIVLVKKEVDSKYILIKENAHASYYHDKFNGRRTASGKRFNNKDLTAAHKKLPFGTKLKITNPKNKKSVIVTITDRGPFVKGREIDLSKRAFQEISHAKGRGVLQVRIEKLLDDKI